MLKIFTVLGRLDENLFRLQLFIRCVGSILCVEFLLSSKAMNFLTMKISRIAVFIREREREIKKMIV